MTQTIAPIRLRAAAEHLEWVLLQYPDSADVQGLLRALGPLIEDAKAGLIKEPIDSGRVPGTYANADGVYIPYRNPSVEDAYAKFKVELGGGLTEQDKKQHAEMEAFRQALLETRL
ncbi:MULTISPECIES: hypothetical protein [unclassified Luteimonas]